MTEQDRRVPFLEDRRRYGEDFDKTIKPTLDAGLRMIAAGVEYGKLAISSLILANGGGLAGLLAIQTIVKDFSQTWLLQTVGIAALFAVGLCLAIAAAAVSAYNYTQNALASFAKMEDDDLWLKRWHFTIKDVEMIKSKSGQNQSVLARAGRRSAGSYRWALGLTLASAAMVALGGIALAYKLMVLTLV